MEEYSLILSEIVRPNSGRRVFELYKNEESLLTAFYEQIADSKEFMRYFNKAVKIIENALDDYRLTDKKWKKVQYPGLDYTIYEAKADKIRIYIVQDLTSVPIVVTGGKKTEQGRDIQRVVNHINRYRDELYRQSDT